MLKSIITFCKLPLKIKLLSFEVFLELTLACIQLKTHEFKELAAKLGSSKAESSQKPIEPTQEMRYLKGLIPRIAELLPWRCVCFPQAIAGQKILNKKNIPSTLYLGLQKEDEEMKAHAWLRAGQYIVTGDNGIHRYTIINSFTHEVPQ